MALTQVSTSGVKDGSISTVDLADDAVTADKLNNTGVSAGSYNLSSITVDAQGRVTAASSGTPVDADKIIEGNTQVEAVDTGSDGHIKATTEGSERLRVGPAGQVGIAGANYGTTGQVLMSGGASASPTWGDVSSSPTFEATASGAIANGDAVIIQSNGQVAAVTGESATTSIGNSIVVETDQVGSTHGHGVSYDPVNDKIIVAYTNTGNSDILNYRIGTVGANQTITWTSQANVGNDGWNPRLVYDTNSNKMVVGYRDNNNNQYGTARVGTIASGGGSISWGSATVFENGYAEEICGCFDSTNNKVIFAYRDRSNGYKGTAVVGTVSGTSISFGTPAIFETGETQDLDIAFDENAGKVVFHYNDQDDGGKAKLVVGTVSGTSISFGSITTVPESYGVSNRIVYFAAQQKMFICYQASPGVTTRFATVSGTSITVGSAEVVLSDNAGYINVLVYHPVAQKVMVSYRYSSEHINYRMAYYKNTGSNIDFDAGGQDTGKGQSYHTYGTYDPDTKQIVTTYIDSDSYEFESFMSSIFYSNTNLTATNYIGISDAAYSNGATATIQVVGSVDDAQSGLTPGITYYVQSNGTLGSTADTPSVEAGTAVAATKLLIK